MICSLSESNVVSTEPPAYLAWMTTTLANWTQNWMFTRSVAQTRLELERAAGPARQVRALIDPNSPVARNIDEGIDYLMQARLPLKTAQKQLSSLQQANMNLNRAVIGLDNETSFVCAGGFSPRSGMPRASDLPNCFSKHADWRRATGAVLSQESQEASLSVLEKVIDKAI